MAIQSDGNAEKVAIDVKLVARLAKAEVSRHYKMNLDKRCRKREYIRARLVYFLATRGAFPIMNESNSKSYPTLSYLGYTCGGRDHATVFNAIHRCQDLLTDTDKIFLEALTKKLSKFRFDYLRKKHSGEFKSYKINREEQLSMLIRFLKMRTFYSHKESHVLAEQILDLLSINDEQNNRTD
jgi:hypothetical protein